MHPSLSCAYFIRVNGSHAINTASGSGGASVEDIRRRSEGGANDFNNVSEKQLGMSIYMPSDDICL